MKTTDLDFKLPPELIAQVPPAERPASRLMRYRRSNEALSHHTFADLPKLLQPGDLLVMNDTRVIPARFTLRKPTGGAVEGLFISAHAPGHWVVMLKNAGPGVGAILAFAADPSLSMHVEERLPDGCYRVKVSSHAPAETILAKIGRMPLPPYIRREKERDVRDDTDRERYQSVFAKSPGAIAAPTASLHFSDRLLNELEQAGIQRTFVTLHVGIGTFKTVTTDEVESHTMHREAYSMSAEAAQDLTKAKREGRRIIAVGSTAARVLESQPAGETFEARSGETEIFIYPPYEWKHVAGLITNFHLPRSTLIAMVAALVGLERQRMLYDLAIKERYRFFSYGDAMLIE